MTSTTYTLDDVKRYGIHTQCVSCGCMGGGWMPVVCPGGPFVEWHEYELLVAENAWLKAERDTLKACCDKIAEEAGTKVE